MWNHDIGSSKKPNFFILYWRSLPHRFCYFWKCCFSIFVALVWFEILFLELCSEGRFHPLHMNHSFSEMFNLTNIKIHTIEGRNSFCADFHETIRRKFKRGNEESVWLWRRGIRDGCSYEDIKWWLLLQLEIFWEQAMIGLLKPCSLRIYSEPSIAIAFSDCSFFQYKFWFTIPFS